ncbi:MAG: response regulator [Myxococcales bacterium]|nr:response regulator [Myxococcales bacterium]
MAPRDAKKRTANQRGLADASSIDIGGLPRKTATTELLPSVSRSAFADVIDNRVRFRNILLAGNPYGAFLLEEAGFRASGAAEPADAPSFDLVRSGERALEILERGEHDMLLADHILPDLTGSELVAKARARHPELAAAVVTANTDLGGPRQQTTDSNLFIAYGAPSFWRALVKLAEDERNAEALIDDGRALAILLVEDEPNFYSHFLPMLYERIRSSAIELLPPERRPRSIWSISDNRPLVLLRRTFEDAANTLVRHQSGVMALITDLRFPVSGEPADDAGLRLLYRARSLMRHLPVVVASRERHHRDAVMAADAKFLWKDSPRLLSELDSFLTSFCGFGPFVFRWPAGERYGVARTLRDLYDLMADVPDVVFEHHALHSDFSTWLAVHGYPRLARRARDMRITEPYLRDRMLEMFREALTAQEADGLL